MRLSSSSLLAKSRFSIGTPDTVMDRSNGSSSSTSPAPGPPWQRSTPDVDKEYVRAFKSSSFLDLWSHAHSELSGTHSSSSSKSSFGMLGDEADEPSCSYTVFDDFVLKPSPEALVHSGCRRQKRHSRRRVEALLLEYFYVTWEACAACSALLAAAGAARRHHLVLRHLLRPLDNVGGKRTAAARDELEQHVRLDNPLSPAGCRVAGFRDMHTRCAPLSRRLFEARRRLRRLARAARFERCAAAIAIVGASAAAVVAAVVLAAHVVVGVGAAVALAFCATTNTRPSSRPTCAVKKLIHHCHCRRRRRHARACKEAAADAAERGAYIVGRDMDTLSRMVWRAHGELEHGRDMARIAVSGGQGGDRPSLLLQEVAREEEECGEDLRCQLEELEEHACLCLLTINRSRRMVATVTDTTTSQH